MINIHVNKSLSNTLREKVKKTRNISSPLWKENIIIIEECNYVKPIKRHRNTLFDYIKFYEILQKE